MEESLFRKNSVEHISSPEQLNDYLRVTSPAIWVVLIAVIILLAGVLIWASFANIDSFVTGTAQVEDGKMVIIFGKKIVTRKKNLNVLVKTMILMPLQMLKQVIMKIT